MANANALAILAGINPQKRNRASAPTNLHVFSGEVYSKSEDGTARIRLDGLVFSENDSQWVEIDTLGGLEEGDTATILLAGEEGKGMTPLAIGAVGGIDRLDVRIASIEADYIKAEVLDAQIARIDKLEVDTANIVELVAEKADISDLNAATARIGNLEAADVTITGRLDTAEGNITNLTSSKADISDLNAATARIGNLEAADVTITGRLDTAEGNITNLTSSKADISDLNAATARIGNLEADHVTVADFQAEQANIDTLQANTADIATIRANSAKVANLTAAELEADHATIGQLDTNFAHADMANVSNAWIENGTVKDGAITNAMINSVSANKLTAGTIDASNIAVTNLNADNITVGTINGQRIGEGSLSLSKLEDDVYTETEVDAKLATMQAEIDGAIETWTGTEVPTLQNSPASSWNTTALKDSHVGDVYFVVNSQSQQNGYNYRFTKSGSTYSWQLIKDTDITNALQRLTDAEGRIGTIEQFDSTVSSYMTDTDEELSSIKSVSTTLAGRVTTAEEQIATKVEQSTFNTLSQTVNGNSASITQLTTATELALSESVEYVVGTQTKATGNWTGITRETSLRAGKTIAYKLPYAGSGNASLTLTLADGTGTDAIAVYTNTTRVTTHFGAGSVIQLTYDGTYWRAQSIPDTNNYDRMRHYNQVWSLEEVSPGGCIVCGTENGYRKVAAGVSFDLGYPLLVTGGVWMANTAYTNAYEALRTVYPNVTGTVENEVIDSIIWLKGTVNGNTFAVANVPFFTCTVPTTEDGYFYIPLGITTHTDAAVIFFTTSNQLYAYVGSAFMQVNAHSMRTATKVSEIDQTIDGITTRVGSLETTIVTKADGSTVETVSSNLSTLQQDVNGFKTSVANTYATKTELSDAEDSLQNAIDTKAASSDLTALTDRVSTAESTIEQHGTSIALKANSADVYTKQQSDGLISTEVTNRNAAITAATEAIELSVSETYSTKTEVNAIETIKNRYYASWDNDVRVAEFGYLGEDQWKSTGQKEDFSKDFAMRVDFKRNSEYPTQRYCLASPYGVVNLDTGYAYPVFAIELYESNNRIRFYCVSDDNESTSQRVNFIPTPDIWTTVIVFWHANIGAFEYLVTDEDGRSEHGSFTPTGTFTGTSGVVWIGADARRNSTWNVAYEQRDMPAIWYETPESGSYTCFWDLSEMLDGTPTAGSQVLSAATGSAIESAKAAIKVTTDGISTEVAKKVNGTEIISTINQSAETVKIQASKVDITGDVVFSAINNDTGTTKISGGKIDATSITIGQSQVTGLQTALDGKQPAGDYATTTQAQGYATTAKSEAISAAATDATNKVTAARVWYATCDTAAATTDKVATTTVSGFTLYEGVVVNVKFTNTNSGAVASLTLNVNNTGAKSIKTIYNSSLANLNAVGQLQANSVVRFVYSGTYWIADTNYNSDTYNRTRWQNLIQAVDEANAVTSGHIICGTVNGYRDIGASVSFDLSYPLLYAGSSIASASGTNNNAFLAINSVNVTPNGAVQNAAPYSVLYLKGTLSGNTITLAASNFMTCTVPTSADGFVYIPIGMFYNSTTSIYFSSTKELWAYVDEAFGPVSVREASAAAKTATNYISADTSGIKIHKANDADNYIHLTSDGMDVYKDDVNVASFGDTTRLGLAGENNIEITPASIKLTGSGGTDALDVNTSGSTMSITVSEPTNMGWVTLAAGNSITATFAPITAFPSGQVFKMRLAATAGNYTVDVPIRGWVKGTAREINYAYHDIRVTISLRTDDVVKLTNANSSGTIKLSVIAIQHDENLLAPAFTFGTRDVDYSTGGYSSVEGYDCVASGDYSHAEGYNSSASAQYSHAQNLGTSASYSATTAIGTYNKDLNKPLVIGNGIAPGIRSNAAIVDWSGNYIGLGMAGMIQMFAGSDAPAGWLICDGSAVSRTTYEVLFIAIGTTWGSGDGSTTFNLPDLRGRGPIGAGTGSGLSARTLGDTGGSQDAVIPYHRHHVSAVSNAITGGSHTHPLTSEKDAASGSAKNRVIPTGAGSSSSSGGATATTHKHDLPQHYTDYVGTSGNVTEANMQPFAVVNFIICTGKTD